MITNKTAVPFVDLHAQYLSIKDEIDSAIGEVIRRSAFVRGPFVDTFEAEFSAMMGRTHCVSCANGTDSLFIAMRALGIKPGDEVLAPAHSWISTTETITLAGGTVIFCDTDADTFTIDPGSIEDKISSRTVGIIPVHLYGQSADMDRIMQIARKHKLWVLEDCAQAHLARFRGQLVGTFGEAASFSFYPGKNLGAMGDAGAITTNDPDLARRMAMFARHGGLTKGDHEIEGINSRLDGLQAAILSVKLRHLKEWTRARRQLADLYSNSFRDLLSVKVPEVASEREHVWHLYVVRSADRDDLAAALAADGISTVINYPVALPFLPAYKRLAHRPEEFPNAFNNQQTILSLPLYPEMPEEFRQRVIDGVRNFFAGRRGC